MDAVQMKAVPWLWYVKERHKRTFSLIEVWLPVNAAGGRGLEKLKAMKMVYISNSFLCQQGGTTIAKYLHLTQASAQIIHLLSFLSSPLHWRLKLFLQISQKWHCSAQIINNNYSGSIAVMIDWDQSPLINLPAYSIWSCRASRLPELSVLSYVRSIVLYGF